MDKQNLTLASWNVDRLVSRSQKFSVQNGIKKLPSPPTILGLQEIKMSQFLIIVALNTILLDYPRIVSLPDESCGGTTLLYHPSCVLIRFGTLELGRIAWA